MVSPAASETPKMALLNQEELLMATSSSLKLTGQVSLTKLNKTTGLTACSNLSQIYDWLLFWQVTRGCECTRVICIQLSDCVFEVALGAIVSVYLARPDQGRCCMHVLGHADQHLIRAPKSALKLTIHCAVCD